MLPESNSSESTEATKVTAARRYNARISFAILANLFGRMGFCDLRIDFIRFKVIVIVKSRHYAVQANGGKSVKSRSAHEFTLNERRHIG
jgi:hypothetical protein